MEIRGQTGVLFIAVRVCLCQSVATSRRWGRKAANSYIADRKKLYVWYLFSILKCDQIGGTVPCTHTPSPRTGTTPHSHRTPQHHLSLPAKPTPNSIQEFPKCWPSPEDFAGSAKPPWPSSRDFAHSFPNSWPSSEKYPTSFPKRRRKPRSSREEPSAREGWRTT